MNIRRLLVPSLVLAALVASPVASIAASTTPAGTDCAAEALAYPHRWEAEGATVLGRVTRVRTFPDRYPIYRLTVARAYAGTFGDTVTVRMNCVETKLRLGERYLISSSRFATSDGRIDAITFGSGRSVGWHVNDDGSISLLGYGRGLGDPARPYLTKPDTVYEAAHAVALGKQEQAKCVGGKDNIRARWHMEVDRIHGELEVVIAVDGRSDRHWTVELFHDYGRFTKQQRIDDFEIVRHVKDRPGTDRIGFKAVQADGQVCRGIINL